MKLRFFLSVGLFSGLFLLTGCSQLELTDPKSPQSVVSSAEKENLWKKRQQSLNDDVSWSLRSKIALRFRQEHWTFGLNWANQAALKYAMQITNPVTGGMVAKLSRTPSGVSLLADDGKIYTDSNEERLLQNRAGLRLPVQGMQFWARGLIYPKYKIDKLVLDSYGRPQSIIQAGWSIQYSRYTSNQFNAMPRKVVITNTKEQIYLKMIAKQWQGI